MDKKNLSNFEWFRSNGLTMWFVDAFSVQRAMNTPRVWFENKVEGEVNFSSRTQRSCAGKRLKFKLPNRVNDCLG